MVKILMLEVLFVDARIVDCGNGDDSVFLLTCESSEVRLNMRDSKDDIVIPHPNS